MRSIASAAVLLLAAVVSAVSTAGNRLLVVLDDVSEKNNYNQFFGDLKGKEKNDAYPANWPYIHTPIDPTCNEL